MDFCRGSFASPGSPIQTQSGYYSAPGSSIRHQGASGYIGRFVISRVFAIQVCASNASRLHETRHWAGRILYSNSFLRPVLGFDFCIGSIPQMKPLSCLSGISRSHLSARSSCMHAISLDTKPAVFCCFRPSAGKARRVHMAVNCLPASFLFATRVVVDRPRPQRVSRH